MAKLQIEQETLAQQTVDRIYADMRRRIEASPSAICPVDLTAVFLKNCMVQTCGKCTPCRVGLKQLSIMLDDILNNRADMYTLEKIEVLATNIKATADCAIGTEAANMVLRGLEGFRDDYISHIQNHRCIENSKNSIPCINGCPAHVDVPGYISLVAEKRYDDAVWLIRKDNPFPSSCAYVCEHPCEERCRRSLLDAPVNIRGMKRVAVENATNSIRPWIAKKTGKKVAIIGAGPSGLSCAYYLQQMGHEVTVFEKRKRLGGMLRYGIPAYRLPRNILDKDIDFILSTGIKVEKEYNIDEKRMNQLRKDFDAVYIAIGAHTDKKLDIPGSDAKQVISAVEFLGNIGDEKSYDFTDKNVCVIGGGNVAMDCVRTAIRLNAKTARIIYRRRRKDMTALEEEISGAQVEGAILNKLESPKEIVTDDEGNVKGLITTPQMVSGIDGLRMKTDKLDRDDNYYDCDVVIVAIGQNIDAHEFEKSGIPVKRGVIKADNWSEVSEAKEVFAGGDCVSGPKTAISAIASGKVAAANIDSFLGFNHKIVMDFDVPNPHLHDRPYVARVDLRLREPRDRKNDFDLIEYNMTEKEACQEAGRCLRCDHFGCGIFKGGRVREW